MGRKKLQLGLIQDRKKRNITFQKRMKNLKKKAYECSTLCDVPVCVVVYDGPKSKPEIYPENEKEVRGVIERYFSITVEERRKRCERLDDDVLQEQKKRKLEDDNAVLDGYNREELVRLASVVDYKLQCVKEKVGFLQGWFYSRVSSSASLPGDYPEVDDVVFDVDELLIPSPELALMGNDDDVVFDVDELLNPSPELAPMGDDCCFDVPYYDASWSDSLPEIKTTQIVPYCDASWSGSLPEIKTAQIVPYCDASLSDSPPENEFMTSSAQFAAQHCDASLPVFAETGKSLFDIWYPETSFVWQ